ncbi:MAG: hypothetical protein SWH54_19545 [Thermodesulfobacteriota bacterium]|nr:hypothetical protein [Thermodesulfobacteriota bacterium]
MEQQDSFRIVVGWLTIILGIFTLTAFAGEVFDLKNIALTGLVIYLILAPVWAFWLGISLVRGKELQLANP